MSGLHDGDTAQGCLSPDLVMGEDGRARPPWAAADPLLMEYMEYYDDTEWGVPVKTESGVFERLTLEAFQSGLSWSTILRKRPAFREAFANFNPDIVATFDEDAVASLMANPAIIRNERKIRATIRNAQATLKLHEENSYLSDVVWSYASTSLPRPFRLSDIPSRTPESTALAKTLKKKGFSFVGPTTMFALMEALGIVDTHLVGAYHPMESAD
ncbi:DNA-3-methyladenine glycosylase I [Corynebacterium kroppenstedtii]|uniref:DNA-3-methyladenine glycosylase I n=1 Tax=Corynebacterium kroppenstedtii TaxID=161879 RepID=UPI00387310B7